LSIFKNIMHDRMYETVWVFGVRASHVMGVIHLVAKDTTISGFLGEIPQLLGTGVEAARRSGCR
jgi:hypothetical protein